jgi:site-specific recombinase XerD
MSSSSTLLISDSLLTDEELIDRWLGWDGEKPRNAGTQRSYRRAIRIWLEFLDRHPQLHTRALSPLWAANERTALAWQTELLRSGIKASTVNQVVASVSSFYRYALVHYLAPPQIQENPFHNRVRHTRADDYDNVRILTVEEYRRLLTWLEQHSGTFWRLRAHAIIRTLLHTGWRANELLAMRAGDLRPAATTPGAMRYHCRLPDGRGFVDLLPPDCVAVMDAYLRMAQRPLDSLPDHAYIWTAVKKSNMQGLGVVQDAHKPVTTRTLSRVVRTHLRMAGIRGIESISLHDLRHTYAYLLYEGGATGEYVSKRMRLESKRSGKRYLRKALDVGGAEDQSVFLSKHWQPPASDSDHR